MKAMKTPAKSQKHRTIDAKSAHSIKGAKNVAAAKKAPLKKSASKSTRKAVLPIPKPTRFTPQRLVVACAAVFVLALGLTLIRTVSIADNASSKPGDVSGSQENLRQQVETADRIPRDGRDPASQQQNSLAAAASRDNGSTLTDTEGTSSAGNGQPAKPSDVFTDSSKSGIGSNGCYVDYGIQGQQCLPAHAAHNGSLDCGGVRKHFPDGIRVTGTDRFKLDKNGDSIACNDADL